MKALVQGELAESEHGLADVHGAGSTVAVGLRRVTMYLGAMQIVVDADEGLNAVANSFIEDLLARGSDVVLESELEWENRVQALEKAREKVALKGLPREQWRGLRTKVLG